MIGHVEVRRSSYHDSVRLMQAAGRVADTPGAVEALVAMATELNLRLALDMGVDPAALAGAGPDDLLVAIQAEDEASLAAALVRLDSALTEPPHATGMLTPPSPRTVATAARSVEAGVALISVPGRHALVEAMDALRAGLHVMVFSDNVPVEHEVALKSEAAKRGLLVMGPDCGTALIAGAGLGFANAVDPGPVGIAGASGTGIQQLCCLLDDAAVGVRHAIGTGSRDLSAAVGGRSTIEAIRLLDEAPDVDVIAVVAKPPDPDVAERLGGAAAALTTPTVMAMLGAPGITLEAAAADVVAALGGSPPSPASWPAPPTSRRGGFLRGLFSGGTLRDEARSVLEAELGRPVAVQALAEGSGPADHLLVDLGADEFTQGRPHPMIDQRLRLDHLVAATHAPEVGVILIDVVLGYGAHPDPAGELAPMIHEAVQAGVGVVVSLCGTRRDPQGRDHQAGVLHEAGAAVHLANAAAAREAARIVGEGTR